MTSMLKNKPQTFLTRSSHKCTEHIFKFKFFLFPTFSNHYNFANKGSRWTKPITIETSKFKFSTIIVILILHGWKIYAWNIAKMTKLWLTGSGYVGMFLSILCMATEFIQFVQKSIKTIIINPWDYNRTNIDEFKTIYLVKFLLES